MKITNLLTLTDFMEAVSGQIPDIKQFLPLSNGEKAVDEISAYYTDHYKGLTAFFQVADIKPGENLMTFLCSITIATKPANVSARAGLEARNLTLSLLMKWLGKLILLAEESQRAIEDQGEAYDLQINLGQSIFPIGMLANVNLEGHYLDLDITVPATSLLYPA